MRSFIIGILLAGQVQAAIVVKKLLPPQSGHSGKFLTTNGSVASWGTAGSGTVLGTWASTTGNVATTNGASTVQDSGTALTDLATKASPTFTGVVTIPAGTCGTPSLKVNAVGTGLAESAGTFILCENGFDSFYVDKTYVQLGSNSLAYLPYAANTQSVGTTGTPFADGFFRTKLEVGLKLYETTTVTTSNATATTIKAVTLSDTYAYYVEAQCLGRKSDGTDRAFYKVSALTYRDGGGAVLEGLVTAISTIESAGAVTWDSTITVSGNDMRVTVTGQAATTINWRCDTQYQRVQ